VRRHDVVVDDGRDLQGDVVFGHDSLKGDLSNLDLDVHGDEALAERVDLDKAWVDSLVEAAEFGDQADAALLDFFVGIRAADAAWDRAESADYGAEGVDFFGGRRGLLAGFWITLGECPRDIPIVPYQPLGLGSSTMTLA